jgi:tetratricopeptide (TPR) repeat protein
MDKDILHNLEKGREYYANGEYEKAEPFLQQVISAHDDFADVLNMLGIINYDKGDMEQAQEFFERAFHINPNYTEAALNLAVIYNEQGKYDEAKKIHEHASSVRYRQKKNIEPFAKGKITNMHAKLGQAYAEIGLHSKAIEQYHAALSLSPDFVDIRTRLGQLLRDIGRFDEAVIQFKTVIKNSPDYVTARISLGTTYYALGQKELAQKQWQEAARIAPENKTVNMYVKMIEQMMAMEEAEATGVHLEVDNTEVLTTVTSGSDDSDDLKFFLDTDTNKAND